MKDHNVFFLKTEEIIPYSRNPKAHPQEQVEKIVNSIKEFGFINPILVDKENVIVAGHGRFLAAKYLNLKTLPTILVDHLTPNQIKAYRIADNKTAESGWDENLLRIELKDLESTGFDIELTGFTNTEMGNLIDYMNDFENPEDLGTAPPRITLLESFGVPPFSILDARLEYWQKRKQTWAKILS